jgi:2,3-bisphosphoglycerate-dependent phosphoglycerate mutase
MRFPPSCYDNPKETALAVPIDRTNLRLSVAFSCLTLTSGSRTIGAENTALETRHIMQLYIIRHCQSENNDLWQRTGSGDGRAADPALTKIGRQQAEHLAKYIAGSKGNDTGPQQSPMDRSGIAITHLYCSLMSRSIETGLYIAKILGLPLIAREDIHERGGIYLKDPHTNERNGLPGPNRDHFELHFPTLTLPDTLGAEGWWNRPYEDRKAALSRAQSFLEWLLATHDGTDDRVAIVIHGGFIQSLFCVLFETPQLGTNLGINREIWIKINNGSITCFDFLDEVIRLTYLNQFDFLPDHLVT